MNHNPTRALNLKNKSIRPQRGRIFVEKNKRPPTLTTSEKSRICRRTWNDYLIHGHTITITPG